ncbi:hypothetical protein GPU89_08385 [Burkholderia cepacia]|nr:hypothetical protein [Burkholderia cepacia]
MKNGKRKCDCLEGRSRHTGRSGATRQSIRREILVDVTDAQQVKEWTKLLEPRAADDHAEGDTALFTWPFRPVPNAAIYGGVVVTTVSTFALLTGFAIWRRYSVDAELSANRMRFRLRPPPRP